ncbi:hypothetical protein DFR28_102214 [Arenicella xantha]|uniref:Uncharacterized protein n=1 Tax=Arenicella xantha TaxID=644221 RepID=A0A395JMA1_9GAMM|nr:hypothetical protein DFR28_102214 [Arenicella xantha]
MQTRDLHTLARNCDNSSGVYELILNIHQGMIIVLVMVY